MKTTAKVTLSQKVEHGSQVQLKFSPDYMRDGVKVNTEWAEATPSLQLDMWVKPDVAKHFTQGKYYTLTFSESD